MGYGALDVKVIIQVCRLITMGKPSEDPDQTAPRSNIINLQFPLYRFEALKVMPLQLDDDYR